MEKFARLATNKRDQEAFWKLNFVSLPRLWLIQDFPLTVTPTADLLTALLSLPSVIWPPSPFLLYHNRIPPLPALPFLLLPSSSPSLLHLPEFGVLTDQWLAAGSARNSLGTYCDQDCSLTAGRPPVSINPPNWTAHVEIVDLANQLAHGWAKLLPADVDG